MASQPLNHPFSQKSLAIPAPGKQPTFDEVADIVLTGAHFELSSCVLCLAQEMLERWINRLDNSPAPVALLDVLNTNQATLTDWQMFLRRQVYDITVLSGALAEMQAGRLSPGYVQALVDAIPSGLVMLT